MAQSVIMIYESLDSIKKNREYWWNYIDHYEKFWDSPATPQSSWWGMEYEEFRKSLAGRLGISGEHIRNAFFIRNEEGKYFVCPIGDRVNMNILASEYIIPYEWLIMFEPEEKNYFYTHTGFGAIQKDTIYYRTDLSSALARLNSTSRILSGRLGNNNEVGDFPELAGLTSLDTGITNILQWLEGFAGESILILNYGEICSLIEQNSFKFEDSVGEVKSVISSIESGDFEGAESALRLLNAKWSEIYTRSSGGSGAPTLQ